MKSKSCVVAPGFVLEAAVVLVRLDDWFGLLAEHSAGRALPELQVVLPENSSAPA